MTLFDSVGNLKLSPEGLKYICDSCCSDDNPFLIIHLVEDGVVDTLLEVEGNQLINLPQPHISLVISTPE